jgi:hypothetical protein
MTFNNYRPTFQTGGQSCRKLPSPSSLYNSGNLSSPATTATTSECSNSSTYIKVIPIMNKNFQINNINNNNNRPMSMVANQNQRFSMVNYGNLVNKLGLESSAQKNASSRLIFNKRNGFASSFAIDDLSQNTAPLTRQQHQQQQQQQQQRPFCFNNSNYDLRLTTTHTITPQRLIDNIISRGGGGGGGGGGGEMNRLNLKSLPGPTTIVKNQQSDEYSSLCDEGGESGATNTSSESSSPDVGCNNGGGGGGGNDEEYSFKKIEEIPITATTAAISTTAANTRTHHLRHKQQQFFCMPKSLSQQPLNTSINSQRSSSSSHTTNRRHRLSINSNNSFNNPIESRGSPHCNSDALQMTFNTKLANLKLTNDTKSNVNIANRHVLFFFRV